MEKTNYPVTPAVRLLREKKINFAPHLYAYEEHGGTTRAAGELNVPEHAVIKTLVMETEQRKPLIVLMHGDREVSTKQFSRALGVKSVSPCDAATAQKHTGYTVGGISPFGTRVRLPVYVEGTILALPEIYINGGKRGFLVRINPQDLHHLLPITEVDVALVSADD
ncbi:MAG: Cys-tRNA(Pro) deacylase [Pyrinomonadaceae bacterium]|nr:Cys-tRNA(Pro) deacylase [Pyrinomonadaceae bacterium]